MTVYKDVLYRTQNGFRPLSLDLYVPDGPVSALCLYLHGGGWRIGSRRMPELLQRIASLGLAVAAADYRLSGEAAFPAQLEDVADAVDFLAAHRVDYGINAERTVAWGASAGGHLAALLGLTTDVIDAVCCWYPPTDFDALSRDIDEVGGKPDRSANSREGQLIGAGLDERPDLARAASPVAHVREDAPPFLFVHGTDDKLVPIRQSERLAAALRAAGGAATILPVPGAGHMFPELDDAQSFQLMQQSVDFLRTS